MEHAAYGGLLRRVWHLEYALTFHRNQLYKYIFFVTCAGRDTARSAIQINSLIATYAIVPASKGDTTHIIAILFTVSLFAATMP